MKRVVYALLLMVPAVGCGSSRPSARSTLTTPLPDFGKPTVSAQKRTFEKIVEKDPKNKYGWYDLGVIAQSEHHLRTAAADYTKAFTIDPRSTLRSPTTASCATTRPTTPRRSGTSAAPSTRTTSTPTRSGTWAWRCASRTRRPATARPRITSIPR